MVKLSDLYRKLAQQDFRIFKFKKTGENGKGLEFLMHHRNDLLNQIDAKKRNSRDWIINDVLENARKRLAYTQEAEDMVKRAYAQQRTKCDNCLLYLNYPHDLPEGTQLCERLEFDRKLESEEVSEEDRVAAEEMPKEKWCNKYEPIFPDEMALPPIEKEIEEISTWLQEELSKLEPKKI
ncbi:hypothetical protein KY310_01730 [Candidatus Woesearchaeota archaeon]|nr:hypothetical protein [Candidatus Woesearchaeota archaeon]